MDSENLILIAAFFLSFSNPEDIRDVGIAVVKNEADIIEPFVRYNLQFLDALIIMDNNSSDSTRIILKKLSNEGLPIVILTDKRIGHLQEERMNFMIHAIREWIEPEIIIPLDADEFLITPDQARLSDLLQSLDKEVVPQVSWRSYIFTENDDLSEPDPLRRIRHRRATEPYSTCKCILRNHHLQFPNLRLNFGSHRVNLGTEYIPEHLLLKDCALAHYPLRSVEQTTSKILTNWLSTSLRPNLQEGQGYHKQILYEYVRKNLPLTPHHVAYMANNYLAMGCSQYLDQPLQPLPYQDLKYLDLAKIDVVRSLLNFAEDLADQLRGYRN
ncbi:MAG: glycosyltransferase family 2 protein [Gloeomargaritaceae cyanobacterium C42_A2020_066]|nr:glycosyltransferase family 2 protein [Gloeomargaritaceae cyanobacterium C42_A2020_066]